MTEENQDHLITWNDSDLAGKSRAFEQFSESQEAYEGVSKAYHRQYLDIEPNRSVRPSFTSQDYYAFRPEEQTPRKAKRIIKMCMDAYDKVGIVRNVIDLMGDFGCQGINIVHENRSVEKFYKQWFKKCNGKERSERFLNNLYRTGQVFVYKSYASITPEINKYIKSLGQDITLEVPSIAKNLVPWRYNFINPLNIEMKNGSINLFLGTHKYEMTANTFFDNFKDGGVPKKMLETMPPNVKRAISEGKRRIELEEDRLSTFYYKKDDWQQWAHPLTYAILDDIIMLEKMRLADLSALDGAISNIRLWTLGSLDHKILPNKSAINKLRNILASNVGGGTMELVWGPELSYTESNSQVYKFLGSEKYQSVLNSIYAGLGVPPTLTGMASNGGGFTNNFISLKTLVERLQYGRDQLTKFWESEIEYVRKSMGFRKPAHITYDQMSLSDESSEKNLLIQLADRDIISHETVLERFKEIAPVEKMRLKREQKERDKETLPDKAGPFHNANHKKELEKIDRQSKVNEDKKQQPENNKTLDIKENGRPPFSTDEGPRKKRVETPKSTPGLADLIVWSNDAFEQVSATLNKAFLGYSNKKNLRQLTKAEVCNLEDLKIQVLSNLEPMCEISDGTIFKAVSCQDRTPNSLTKKLKEQKVSASELPINSYKKKLIGVFVEHFFDVL
tara:strand:- start:169 stop:2196 length:2028 start_codon:yes stop_codon:yes gene_type:complete